MKIKQLLTIIEHNQYSEWSSSCLPTIFLYVVNNRGDYIQKYLFLRLLKIYIVYLFKIEWDENRII